MTMFHGYRWLLLMFCLFTASSVCATDVVVEDFQDLAAGTLIHGANGWTVLNSTGSPANNQVVVDPADPANLVLELRDGPENTFHEATLPAGASGVLSFRFRVPAGATSDVDLSIGLSPVTSPTSGTQVAACLRLLHGRFQFFHAGDWRDAQAYATDTWYTLRMAIDNEAAADDADIVNDGSFGVTVQGGAFATETDLALLSDGTTVFGFRGPPPEGDLIRFVARGNNDHAGDVALLDDIVLSTSGASDPTLPNNGYAAWQELHFPGDLSRAAGPFGDPDDDTVINLVEYLLGGDPNLADARTILPTLRAASGDTLKIWFKRSASDGDYAVSHAADLAHWSPVEQPIHYDTTEEKHFMEISTPPARDNLRLDMALQGAEGFTRHAGYQGIWFDLGGTNNGYGTKYSGGLGTYTAKHRHLAVYAPEVEKTFFVYGGTRAPDQRYLLCMAGVYDHRTGKVSRPVVVYDKLGVNDPHDDPSIALDEQGYVWVFVAGRNTSRPGQIFKSKQPYDIGNFEHIDTRTFTYPQPFWIEGKGFFHFFTKYTPSTVRELYFSTSADGRTWSTDVKIGAIGGHYQVSEARGERLATAFNWHPNGNNSLRTNVYYMETNDHGQSWTTIDGQALTMPVTDPASPSLVHNVQAEGRLVFVKDLTFDKDGYPVILYLTSGSEMPGPVGSPRTWQVAAWNGAQWNIHAITDSTHNFDMGSIWIEGDTWRVIGPTEAGPQPWGQGGEIALWESANRGASWTKVRDVTTGSTRNHGYVRRAVNAHPDFYGFWSDGNTDSLSESHLYFTNRDGTVVKKLPYTMTEDWETPAPR